MKRVPNQTGNMLSVKSLQKALLQFEFDLAQLTNDKTISLCLKETDKLSRQDKDHLTSYSLQAVKRSYNTLLSLMLTDQIEHSFQRTWKQVLLELRRQISLRLEGIGLQLSVHSRLSVWERFWTSLRWRYGSDSIENHHLNLSDLKAFLDTCQAITSLTMHMKADPLWSLSDVRRTKGDFFAEESLCQLLNQYQENLQFSLAPLEVDILSAIDLSVKRSKPNRARASFQFSLSAEDLLNQQKILRQKNSAAIAVISPYTLTKFLIDFADREKVGRIYLMLGISEVDARKINIGQYARDLAQVMRKHFAVTRIQLELGNLQNNPQLVSLCELIELFVEHYLGKKASRKYKNFKVNYIEHPFVGQLFDQGSEI